METEAAYALEEAVMRYILRRVKRGSHIRFLLRLAGDPVTAEVDLYGFSVDDRGVEVDVVWNPRRRLTIMDAVEVDTIHMLGALPHIRVKLSRDDVAPIGFR